MRRHRRRFSLFHVTSLLVVFCVLLLAVAAAPVDAASSTTVDSTCTPSDDGGTCKEAGEATGGGGGDGVDDDRLRLDELLKNELHTHQFYINGSWVDPVETSTGVDLLDVVDPSTAEVVARIAAGTGKDVDAAVAAAEEAFAAWSTVTSPEERRGYVEKILEVYLERVDDMGLLISREMGAPVSMARSSQAGAGIYQLESFLEVFGAFQFVRPLPHLAEYDVSEVDSVILMEPVGVVAMITPWNW